MQDLQAPEDLSDAIAVRNWANRVAEYLQNNGFEKEATAARYLGEIVDSDDDLSEEQLQLEITKANHVIMHGVIKTTYDQIQKLMGPAEDLLGELEQGSEDHSRVVKSLKIYRVSTDLFGKALDFLENMDETSLRKAEEAFAEGQKELAKINAVES